MTTKTVPVEPTEGMLIAGYMQITQLSEYGPNDMPNVWSAMIAAAPAIEREVSAPAEPFCYILPGEDMANDAGFIDARIWKEGEFTRPLYATPIPCPKCGEKEKEIDKWKQRAWHEKSERTVSDREKDAEIARLTKELDTVCERCESAVIQSDAGIIAQQAEVIKVLEAEVRRLNECETFRMNHSLCCKQMGERNTQLAAANALIDWHKQLLGLVAQGLFIPMQDCREALAAIKQHQKGEK